MIVCIFLCITSVSAGDFNQTSDSLTADDDDAVDVDTSLDKNVPDGLAIADAQSGDVLQKSTKNKVVSASIKTSPGDIFIKNSNFDIKLVDDKGKPIANQQIQIKFNNKVTNLTTASNGHVFYKLTAKGTYTISYIFKQDGYTTVKGSKTISVVDNSKSKIVGKNYVAYVGANNPFTVKLTVGGVDVPNQKIVFKIKGKKYTGKTNSKGRASLAINLSKGTYTIQYGFKMVKNAKTATGSSKITVKKGMPTKIVRMNSVAYKHQIAAPLIFKYKDVRGKAIPSKTIVLEFGAKTYYKKTDKEGLVSFTIKKNKGVYKVNVYSYNTDVLKSTSNSYTINVKSLYTSKYNGFWLFGADMKKVNLNDMAKNGVNTIFLNEYAVTLHGKSGVSSFATQAKSLGIKVHIWMSTFYDGDWISPVTSKGEYKYSLFNSLIKDAKDYASIKGIAGIHFDYIRFPGTAYKHTNGVDAVTYFTKTACEELHKLNPSLIVSAAVMPEPSSMVYYYGQDISEISKYLDMIIPMVYKGNYGQGASWIKSVTEQFVKQSNGAIILTGLQGYYSDSNVKKLPASTLINDADYALCGGAQGVIVFRYSLFNMINFNNL